MTSTAPDSPALVIPGAQVLDVLQDAGRTLREEAALADEWSRGGDGSGHPDAR